MIQEQEQIEILKEIRDRITDVRDILMTKLFIDLANMEIATSWLYSAYTTINTGDIAPGDTVQYVINVPPGKANVSEYMEWKLSEWWTATFKWIRDGITVKEEENTVDGSTNPELTPAYTQTGFEITNNSSTYSVKALVRWHYAMADFRIYNGYLGAMINMADRIIKETLGIER